MQQWGGVGMSLGNFQVTYAVCVIVEGVKKAHLVGKNEQSGQGRETSWVVDQLGF